MAPTSSPTTARAYRLITEVYALGQNRGQADQRNGIPRADNPYRALAAGGTVCARIAADGWEAGWDQAAAGAVDVWVRARAVLDSISEPMHLPAASTAPVPSAPSYSPGQRPAGQRSQ